MVIYNQDFYEKEFENNGVYSRFNKSFVDEQNKEVMDFLLTDKPVINSDFFSKQDKEHLRDVEALMKRIDYYSYFLVIGVMIIFVYLHLFYKKIKDKMFTLSVFWSSISNILMLGILFLLSLNFNWFFIKFHELSFNNDLWMMNPNIDMLVNLYPELFWIHAFTKILLTVLVISTIFGVIGALSYYFISKYKKNMINNEIKT